jgi:thiol-disulfide isomerase/thioredoxin
MKHLIRLSQKTAILSLFVILSIFPITQASAQDKLKAIIKAAGVAAANYEFDMYNHLSEIEPETKEYIKEEQKWIFYPKYLARSEQRYFEALYQYALKNLDNKTGFEALALALEVANWHKKTKNVHDFLYKYYRNLSEYSYILDGITRNLKMEDPVLSQKELTIKLLERAIKHSTNPIVINHARMGLAKTLLPAGDGLDMKTLTPKEVNNIQRQHQRAKKLLNAVLIDSKKKPIPHIVEKDISSLALYKKTQEMIWLKIPKKTMVKLFPDWKSSDKIVNAEKPRSYLGKEAKTYFNKADGKLYKLSKFTIGELIPMAKGFDLQGNPQSLEQYKGRVLLIDFWATWCSPCVAMLPHIAKLKKEFTGRAFQILSVSGDDAAEDAAEFLEDHDYLTWDHWFSGFDKGLIKEWRLGALPQVFLVDHTGRLVMINPKVESLSAKLEELIAAAEKAAKK